MFNPKTVAQDFPILTQTINNKSLVYLDNAATSQKPRAVIDAISHYYETSNANVHRGVHTLSDASTRVWEESRSTIAQFFGAASAELILTRNTTEALNGIAYGWGDAHISEGDVILTTMIEHHADIVPWQQLALRKGAKVEFVKLDEAGRLDMTHLRELCEQHGSQIKLIALTYISNALGTMLPVPEVVSLIQQLYPSLATRPKIAIDGAQAAPHIPVHFDDLDVDFFAFSGHKMLGPMGIGGLLVRKELLESEAMAPWFFGGGMIAEVHTTGTTFNEDISERFTPGTPDVASAVGLAAACRYLQNIGMADVFEHDQELVSYALEKLGKIPQLKLVGPTQALTDQNLDRVGSVSFIYEGVHAHDVAQVLDSEGIAVRSGHHCTMPLHESCGWQATVRVSFQIYNTTEDIDALVTALAKVQQVFGK